MTPKEKALERWWAYYSRVEHTLSEEYSPHEKDIAKGLALLEVDEILSVIWHSPDDVAYWKNVKTEIEQL